MESQACGSCAGWLVLCFTHFWFPAPTQGDEILLKLFAKLRQDPLLRESWFIYIPERNSAGMAGYHARALELHPKVHVLSEWSIKDREPGHTGNPGMWTSPGRKHAFAHELRYLLLANAINFLEDFAVTTEDRPDARRKQLVNEFGAQCGRARVKARIGDGSGGAGAYVGWSACCNDDGRPNPGLHDDILLAACIGNYFSGRFLQKVLPYVPYEMFEPPINMWRTDRPMSFVQQPQAIRAC